MLDLLWDIPHIFGTKIVYLEWLKAVLIKEQMCPEDMILVGYGNLLINAYEEMCKLAQSLTSDELFWSELIHFAGDLDH